MTDMRRKGTPRVARSDKECRSLLIAALRHALTETGTSQTEAARWFGVGTASVQRWLSGTAPIRVESVLRSRVITQHFLRCLALMDRKTRRVR
jgi:predicted transcriptional regulator